MKKLLHPATIFLLLVTVSTSCSQNEPIRFGVIADIQYCDCETRGQRYYRNSLNKLEECVTYLNNQKLDFTVNLGDLLDRDTPRNLNAVTSILNKLNRPLYNTTGNHDYDLVNDNDSLYRAIGMPAEYYSFRKNDWRFVMLNTNEISSYASKTEDKLNQLATMKNKIKDEGRKNGASYNGGISKQQLEWVENELKDSEKKKEKVIILSHHPLYAAPGLTALNDLEIIEVLSKYSCVKASISGHHHPGDFGTYNGIHFITTEGMIETENDNAYATVDIYEDRIEFNGMGRTKSHKILLN